MKPKYNLRHSLILAASGSLLAISSASAANSNGTWSANSAGNWSDTTKWTSGTVADGVGFTAFLSNVINQNRTITLDSDRSIGNIFAQDTTHNYTIGGSKTLTLDVSTGAPEIGVVSGRQLTISSKLAGDDGLKKTGQSTLFLQADNTGLSGTIDLQAGRLSAGASGIALGTEFGTGMIDVTSGAYIRFFNNSNTSTTAYANDLTLRGNGDGLGALQNDTSAGVPRDIFWGGTITLAADATISAINSGRYTFNGDIGQSGGSRTLSFTGLGNTGPHAINAGLTMGTVNHTGGGEVNFGSASVIDVGTWSSAAGTGALNFGTATVTALGTLTTARDTNLGKANQLTASTIVNVNGGIFNIGGFNQTIGSLAGSGSTLNLGSATLTTGGNDASTSFDGTISGTGGGLTKNGTGTMTLSGTNTYTGATTVNAGTLTVGASGTLSGSAATLAVNNTNSTAAGTNVVLNLTTGADTTVGSLSGTIATPTTGTNTATINTQTSRTFTVNQTSNSAYAGVIAGNGGFTLGSSSTHSLTLSGTNTYTGATNVNAGTLLINGSTSSTSLVTVASGATLGGSGTVGGHTTISGTHNPGNSPGIQTFSSNLSYVDGGTPDPAVNWELTGNTSTNLSNPNAIFDQVIVGGNLDFTDLTTINLIFNGAGSNVLWANAFWDSDQSWLVYDVAGTTSNFGNLSLNTINWLDSGSNLFSTTGGAFALTQSGQDVILSYTVVPEPRAALLGGLGLLALLRRRRA